MTMSNKCERGALITLDWGTTNVRAALLDKHGHVLEERRGESGVGKYDRAQFEQRFDQLTVGWPPVPAMAAGMVGSRQGWSEAAYLPCPASINDLVQGLHEIAHEGRRIIIVPGVKLDDGTRCDVMRGEESQLAGLLTQISDFSGTVLMPGTHSKWVSVKQRTICNFYTYMTGDLFEAFSQHSILRHSVDDSTGNIEQFAEKARQLAKVTTSIEGEIFGLRARHLLTNCSPALLHQELSALLIMGELRAGQADGFELEDEVLLIGSDVLTSLYQVALEAIGKRVKSIRGSGLVWPALFAMACHAEIIEGVDA